MYVLNCRVPTLATNVVFFDGTFTQLLRQWPEENNTPQTIDNYVTRSLFLTKMTGEY